MTSIRSRATRRGCRKLGWVPRCRPTPSTLIQARHGHRGNPAFLEHLRWRRWVGLQGSRTSKDRHQGRALRRSTIDWRRHSKACRRQMRRAGRCEARRVQTRIRRAATVCTPSLNRLNKRLNCHISLVCLLSHLTRCFADLENAQRWRILHPSRRQGRYRRTSSHLNHPDHLSSSLRFLPHHIHTLLGPFTVHCSLRGKERRTPLLYIDAFTRAYTSTLARLR